MGIWGFGFGFGFVSFVSRKVSVSPRTLDLLLNGDGSSQLQPVSDSVEEIQHTLPPFDFPCWETGDQEQVCLRANLLERNTIFQKIGTRLKQLPRRRVRSVSQSLCRLVMPLRYSTISSTLENSSCLSTHRLSLAGFQLFTLG